MEALTVQQLAPAAVVDATGRPTFGAYRGHVPEVRWDGLAGPFARSALWKKLHHKRWHYLGVVHRDVILAAAIIDVGLASSAFLYVFERAQRHLACDRSWTSLPGKALVSDAPVDGALSRYAAGATRIELSRPAGGARWSVSVVADEVSIAVELDARLATSLCAIAPLVGGVANCTHKTLGIPTIGRVSIGSRSHDLDGGLASFDHTSGLLARDTAWRWASGTSAGLSFNLVEGFNGDVENVLWHGDRMFAVGPVAFAYDPKRTTEPWRIRSLDGRLTLTFTPEGERRQDKDLLVAKSWYVQPFGTFAGTYRAGDDETLVIHDVSGVTEDHVARW